MNAIVDSNVSTMLTAAFLFQFGTGPVKGFAVTLILGILASMVTAIFVTRTFFMVYLARKQQLQTLSI
jgi:preprotein translocase subunit SecD